jgi:hypothetical protein
MDGLLHADGGYWPLPISPVAEVDDVDAAASACRRSELPAFYQLRPAHATQRRGGRAPVTPQPGQPNKSPYKAVSPGKQFTVEESGLMRREDSEDGACSRQDYRGHVYSVAEVATAFSSNLTVFLILRALFGIGMGGEWGVGTPLVMVKVPGRWRGALSGLLQEVYAAGYLLSAVAAWFMLDGFGWRVMFLLGGLPALPEE